MSFYYSVLIANSVKELRSRHFQPGEGLLRDCTTSPINRLQHKSIGCVEELQSAKNIVPMVDIIFYLKPVVAPHPSLIQLLCFCYIVLDFYHKEIPNHPKKGEKCMH